MFGWLKQIFSPVQRGRIEVDGRVIDENTEILALTKVVGVTRKNSDGVSRQKVIGKLRAGALLSLIPEPDNPVDPDAVLVAFEGNQIGYLTLERAQEFVARARDREYLFAVVQEVTGGDKRGGKSTYGVNIAIVDA